MQGLFLFLMDLAIFQISLRLPMKNYLNELSHIVYIIYNIGHFSN